MAEEDTFPQEVLDKIEEAYRTGAKSLSLVNHGLTSFPNSISRLTELKQLCLYQNYLSHFPEILLQLTNLIHLNISNNQLNTLPKHIWKLEKLEEFDFSENSLSIPPEIESGSIEVILNYFKELAENGN